MKTNEIEQLTKEFKEINKKLDAALKSDKKYLDGIKRELEENPVIMCASCESVEIDPERDYRHECKSCRTVK